MRFVLCCAIFTSYSVSVNGDLNKVFGGLGNALQKASSDIKNAFNLKPEDRITFEDNDETEREFPTAATKASVVVETTTHPSTATINPNAKSNSTTVKDGRENFAGACSTGFQRTADGRCMKEY